MTRNPNFFGFLGEIHSPALRRRVTPASLLDEFWIWYNPVRSHQHLGGATPMEVWRGVDPYLDRAKSMRWVSFWDGRLAGYWMRR